MTSQSRTVVRRILRAAQNAPHFFDLSDAERMVWLILRAYDAGRASVGTHQPRATARVQVVSPHNKIKQGN